MPHCFLGLFFFPGWAVWPVDVCAGLPGVSEERGIHLQHPHEQESAHSEAGASSRWPDGGENDTAKLSEVTVPRRQCANQMSDDWQTWGFKVPLLEPVKCEDPGHIPGESRSIMPPDKQIKSKKKLCPFKQWLLSSFSVYFRMWKRFTQEIFVLFLGSTVPAETLLYPRPAPTSPW